MKKYDIDKAITYHKTGIELIRARKLKEIVSPHFSKEHVGEEILICDREKAYGIIILNEPTALIGDWFKNHFSRHLISDKCKDDIWPNVTKLNVYTFRIKKIFKEPLEYRYEGQKNLGISELIKDAKIIDKAKEALEAVVNKYKVRLETLKGLNCDENKSAIKNAFINLFELYLKRMLQKSDHAGTSTRCPSGMVRDRRTGRCVRRKTKEKVNV